MPKPVVGARLPRQLLDRMDSGRQRVFTLFPASPPKLESYLAAQDELGNTAIQPGALFDTVVAEPWIQGAKYRAAAIGLRYSLNQDFTYTGVPDTPSGSPNMGYYTLKLEAKWSIYDAPVSGSAGGLTAEVEAKEGLGGAGVNQSAKGNIGSLVNPTGVFSSRNGLRVPELAWQESFAGGRAVAIAGVVDQGNYIDVNTYANSGRGQFINSALVNSMVLPLSAYNFAVNLQWQPAPRWYAMLGASAGGASAGQTPWTNFSWEKWSVVSEVGFAPEDLLGLGPGVYRLQPFLARAGARGRTPSSRPRSSSGGDRLRPRRPSAVAFAPGSKVLTCAAPRARRSCRKRAASVRPVARPPALCPSCQRAWRRRQWRRRHSGGANRIVRSAASPPRRRSTAALRPERSSPSATASSASSGAAAWARSTAPTT